MAMSKEHKAALAQGRLESRAIKSYLKALERKRPGRPVNEGTLRKRLDTVSQKLESAENPLESVELLQKRIDIENSLQSLQEADDFEMLEAGFIEHAGSYSERKDISYTAWREFGVPAKTLRSAGIKETRRRK